MSTMKVQILNKKLVKPCTPTPPILCTYKLSCMDELNTPMNVIAILYYSASSANDHLEKSLAEILPRFYPLTGRYIREHHFVECKDQGAEFVEARDMDTELLDIIGSVDGLKDLLPWEIGSVEEVSDPLLSVQVTKFRCGGIAIGFSISHRIFDACSLATFISAWAKASRGDHGIEPIINPNFDSSLYFPAENYLYFGAKKNLENGIVVKRILFDKKAIATLRDRVSHLYANSDRPPSRVVMVSSFLALALMRSDRAKHGQSRPCVIMQEVNVRERTVPPLSKYTCGNLVLPTTTRIEADESKSTNFECFVPLLRSTIKKAIFDCGRIKLMSNGGDGHKMLKESFLGAVEKLKSIDAQGLRFTDWSKFEFYEADFGFGKPVWASAANTPLRNLVKLMNTKDNDGIEAWLHLDEEDMVYFERDEEIKKFTQ